MNPVAWHRQQGIFIAAGPAIRQDELLHGANLLDIAPTVLTLLGIPVPDDMDGRALLNILKHPPSQPARVASYEEPHPHDGIHRDIAREETDPGRLARRSNSSPRSGISNCRTATTPMTCWRRRFGIDAGTWRRSTSRPAARRKPSPSCASCWRSATWRPCGAASPCVCWPCNGPRMRWKSPRRFWPRKSSLPWHGLIQGQAKLRLDDTAEALRLLEPLAKDELRLPRLSLALGQTYLRCGMIPEAERAFRRALERDEDDAEAHDGLGVVLRRQKRYEDAIYEHMRAAALEHQHAQTHINLGIALAKHGQVDWAIRAFETAARLAPDHPFPQRCLARMYFSAKKDRDRARFYAAEMLRLRRARREREQNSSPATA